MITDLKINEAAKRRYYELGYWSDATLADAWGDRVAATPDVVYVQDDLGSALTYGQVDDAAARLASWLIVQGVRNGDVVSFQVPKWAEFAAMYVACLKVGAVMHPLAMSLNAADLDHALNQVGATVYACPTFYHKTDYEAQMKEVLPRAKSVRAVLLFDKEFPAHDATLATYSHVVESYSPHAEPAPSKSDDVACILSTSGTTGKPKAALFTHNAILFSERSYASVLDLSPADAVWMPSPLNHATGFYHGLIATMLFGGRAVLQLKFDAESAVALINREGCTWSHGATPFVHDMLAHLDATGKSVPTLRFYLCGGAPVPSSMVERAANHGFLLCESYGSTESCPHVYVPLDKCLEWDGRFSGVPYEGIEVRVVDERRREVPRGVQGEEASRGPHMFAGYLNDARRTDEALDDDGWFYSGDLCTMDEQGRIRINGRKKEIIIRGGENISAREVDERVEGWPHMVDHATIGMPDERLGERICLFAVPSPEAPAELCLSDLTAFLEERGVAKRLWPERLEAIGAIPRTATGKVKRHELAAELKRRMGLE